jgi:hypothetical protein
MNKELRYARNVSFTQSGSVKNADVFFLLKQEWKAHHAL